MSMIPLDNNPSLILDQASLSKNRNGCNADGLNVSEPPTRSGSHWRASPGARPEHSGDIVTQLLDFMTNETTSTVPNFNDGPSRALQSGGAGGPNSFQPWFVLDCDDRLSEKDPKRRSGYPLSMCVQGDDNYFQLSEDDLRKVFRRYGEVSIIEVIGPEKDVAHIYYKQLTDARNAVQDLNDKMLKGVEGVLRVAWGLYTTPDSFTNNTTTATDDDIKDKRHAFSFDNDATTPGIADLTPCIYTPIDVLNNIMQLSSSVDGSEDDDNTMSQLMSELRTRSSPFGYDDSPWSDCRPFSAACIPEDSSETFNVEVDNEIIKEHTVKDLKGVVSNEGKRRSPSRGTSPKGSGGGPIRKFTCRFDIGIDNDKEFQVARRIIGNKGANMKRIVNLSNAKLRLRGQGSGYLEGAIRQESPDPLHLCISCVGRDGYNAAVNETKTLLNKVYNEYRNYEMNKGNKDPGIINIQMKEHFLTGPPPGNNVINRRKKSNMSNSTPKSGGGNRPSSGGAKK